MSNEQTSNQYTMNTTDIAAALGIRPDKAAMMCQTRQVAAKMIKGRWYADPDSVAKLVKQREQELAEIEALGELWPIGRVAEELNMSVNTLRVWCLHNKFPGVKVPAHSGQLAWHARPTDVEAFKADPTAFTKPRKPRKVAKPAARQEPTPWQARPAWDWATSIRARREDVLHAAISKYRGAGQ